MNGTRSTMTMYAACTSLDLVMPNDLISHKIIRGNQKTSDYQFILKAQDFPIMKLNFGNHFSFSKDKAFVHKVEIIKKSYIDSGIKTVSWPAISILQRIFGK